MKYCYSSSSAPGLRARTAKSTSNSQLSSGLMSWTNIKYMDTASKARNT